MKIYAHIGLPTYCESCPAFSQQGETSPGDSDTTTHDLPTDVCPKRGLLNFTQLVADKMPGVFEDDDTPAPAPYRALAKNMILQYKRNYKNQAVSCAARMIVGDESLTQSVPLESITAAVHDTLEINDLPIP